MLVYLSGGVGRTEHINSLQEKRHPMTATIDYSSRMKPNVDVPIQRAALSDHQRRLVESNIGLVYVHMKHYVTPRRIPWTQREWEDLVQEGTLGLIRAAQDFLPHGSIPFAAFALPRIHTAVRKAMLQRFGNAIGRGKSTPARGPAVVHADRLATIAESRADSVPDACAALDGLGDRPDGIDNTVGARLREKYERAVRRAVEKAKMHHTNNAGDSRLPELLATERFLVPDPLDRKPYRRIARDSGVPYTRVLHYDRMLREFIRRSLENDPEFEELLRLSRSETRGLEVRLTGSLEKRLALLGSAELLQRLLHSSDQQRGQLAARLFALSAQSLNALLLTELQSLPARAREELLSESTPVPIYNPDTKTVEMPGSCRVRHRNQNLSPTSETVVES